MITAKLDQLSHKFDSIQVNQVSQSTSCGACGAIGHQSSECLAFTNEVGLEQINAFNARPMGNSYPNNFNSNWRSQQNPSWSNQLQQSQGNMNINRPPGFQNRTFNQAYQPQASSLPATFLNPKLKS